MNEIKLKQLVAEAVRLDREIAQQQDRLKQLKVRLVAEARVRLAETLQPGSVTFQAQNGDIARVSLPLPALKSKINSEDRPLEKIKAAAAPYFNALFVPSIAFIPIEGFRSEAAGLLGTGALRLIKLCETASHPRVSFETKDSKTARDSIR